MFPKAIKKQAGSMLVISIFVIVVLFALVMALFQILNASSDTLVYEVYGIRAHQAAKSGLEQQLQSLFPLCAAGADLPCQATPAICNNNETVSGNLPAGLDNCNYSVRCVADADFPNYFRFESTGSCTAGDAVVSRTISVDASM